MPKRRSKRSQAIYLTLVYMTMTILVVCIVGILMLLTLGYDFNTKSGKLEQGGLVQFDSRPAGATVMFDGQRLSGTTATKLTAASGDHSVTMQRAGYRDWQKQLTLHHGEVLWFTYAVLVPTNLTPERLASYAAPTSSLATTPSKWYVVMRSDGSPTIDRYDLTQNSPKATSVAIPADSFTAPAEGKPQRFEPIAWADDNRTLIIRHTYNDTASEWLSLDVEDATHTHNLTKQLGIDIKQLQPNASDANRLYVVTTSGELREIKLGDMSLGRVLADRVASIATADSGTITYQTLPDEKSVRTLGYYTDGATKSRSIQSIPGANHLQVMISKYFGDHYIATIQDDRMSIVKVNLPASDSTASYTSTPVTTVTVPGGASLSANTNQRFVMAASANAFAVYDIELQKSTTTTLDGVATTPLRWLDNFHLAAARDGRLVMYEFDGANAQTLASNAAAGDVTFAQDGRYIYYMAAPTPGSYELTRVKLIN